jgi:phage protein D
VKPDWAIKANGRDVTETFRPYLVSIRVRDESKDEADSLTITLDNSGTAITPPKQGDELEILLGYDGKLTALGKFSVDKASFQGPPDQVVITCKSAAFVTGSSAFALESWLVVKTRSWEPATLGDIAKTIAKEHGVELVAPAEIMSMATPHLDQTEEPDAGLIRRLVQPRGYVVKPVNGKLVIAKEGAGVGVSDSKPLPSITIKRSEVTTYSGEWQEGAVYDQVVTHWHDVTTGETKYETAGSGSRTFRPKTPSVDQAEAKQQADAILKRFTRQGGKMSMTMPGRVDLQSERLVDAEGFPYPLSASPSKDAVAKKWILKSVEHVLSRSGFTSSVSGEPFIQT